MVEEEEGETCGATMAEALAAFRVERRTVLVPLSLLTIMSGMRAGCAASFISVSPLASLE